MVQFGIFSALEWEGGGETLTWESMKLAWSPHRNTLVTKSREREAQGRSTRRPRGDQAGAVGMWLLHQKL